MSSSSEDLIRAVRDGDETAVNDAIRAGADPDTRDDRPPHGKPVLTTAAGAGLPAAVRALLGAGASPDITTGFDWTPLRAAAAHGHHEIVGILLAHGADPNSGRMRSSIIKDAIDGSRHYPGPNSERTIALLLEAGAVPRSEEEPLITGAVTYRVSPSILRLLLAHGESADERRADGAPAIVLAARRDDAAAVDVLAAHGADIDLPDQHGRTALMRAAERGHESVVNVLLLYGADRDRQAPDGATAMALARSWGEQMIQHALGARSTGLATGELPPSLVRLRPSHYVLSGDARLFRQMAEIIDHTVRDLGEDEFEILVGAPDSARSFVDRLTAQPTAETQGGGTSIEIDDSEWWLARGSLLNLTQGPPMALPEGLSREELDDLWADLESRG